MPGVLERSPMAKAKGRPRTSQRDDITVKIDRALVGQAKLVATHRGTSVAELLSELLRVPLGQAYLEMLRALEAQQPPKRGGKG